MACEKPCFDCPFVRGADKLHLDFDSLFELVVKHFTEDDGGYEDYLCEEQGDICAGQIAVLANGVHPGLDEFSELGEAVKNRRSDYTNFWIGPWEFLPYHEA